MTRNELRSMLSHPNVAAWLRVIRAGESNQDDSAYTLLNGGGHFVGFADHPYAGQSAPPGLAAGAPQYIPHTWQRLVEQYGFPDFSPACQDEGAVALTAGRGALEYVIAGNLAGALQKCRQEWTSLASMPFARAQAVFEQYGGSLAGEQEQPTPAPAPQPEKPMGAALAILPFIMQLIPALHGIPGLGAIAGAIPTAGAAGGSPHAADYLPLVQTVVDTFTKAVPGAANPAMAVGMAQADPTLQATAAQAVLTHPDVVEQLNKMVPIFDKLHQYDKDAWAAAQSGRASAAAVAQHDTYDVAPVMVGNVTASTWALMVGMGIGVVLSIAAKAVFPDLPDYAGMIIPALALVAGQIMKERGAIIGYRFDGTPASNATAAVNAQLAQIAAPPKP